MIFGFFAKKKDRRAEKKARRAQAEQAVAQIDSAFRQLYRQGRGRCGMNDNPLREWRFFHLIQTLQQTANLSGGVTECGCWRGLSSFLMCKTLHDQSAAFRGENFHIFDSFQGLSAPTPEDALEPEKSAIAGKFSATLADVKKALADFPLIQYHAGWIPQTFAGLSEQKYRFVHVDLDLYQPTRDAIEYFYPRLAAQGLLVCDDYETWAGAKRAVDEYAKLHKLSVATLPSGQAVLKHA